MIFVLMAISFVVFFIGKRFNNYDDDNWILWAVGGIFIFATAVSFIVLIGEYSSIISINDKITLYENQNQQIQQEISTIVENYQNHESDLFIQEASPITLVETYPELKSNELVSKQIDLYVRNNDTILELKEKKIDLKTIGWWLFFNIGVDYDLLSDEDKAEAKELGLI